MVKRIKLPSSPYRLKSLELTDESLLAEMTFLDALGSPLEASDLEFDSNIGFAISLDCEASRGLIGDAPQ